MPPHSCRNGRVQGRASLLGGAPGDAKKMLYVALANEISVSELAAAWMPQ